MKSMVPQISFKEIPIGYSQSKSRQDKTLFLQKVLVRSCLKRCCMPEERGKRKMCGTVLFYESRKEIVKENIPFLFLSGENI